MTLNKNEINRYERNILVPGIGQSGQESIKAAKVLVAGLGGLGSPAAYYLAAAGVGTLGLLDFDSIEESNLQRQILHDSDRIGVEKSKSASETLKALNPNVKFDLYNTKLTDKNASDIISKYDAVIEATDNFDAKFLINDTCIKHNKPFASAGILALSGQAMFIVPGKCPCLRCAISAPPEGVPTTAQLGVLGAVPGILGSLEAMELIRWIIGAWKPQESGTGLIHTVNGDSMRLNTIKLPRNKKCICSHLWSE